MLGDVKVVLCDLVVALFRLNDVLTKALLTRGIKEQILPAALSGTELYEARRQFNYHTLQRAASSKLSV